MAVHDVMLKRESNAWQKKTSPVYSVVNQSMSTGCAETYLGWFRNEQEKQSNDIWRRVPYGDE